MATFRNPANGYEESFSNFAPLYALLFGWVYLLVCGLWGHAVLQIGLVLLAGLLTGGPGAMVAVPLWLLYVFITPGLIRSKYLRQGWEQVSERPPVGRFP